MPTIRPRTAAPAEIVLDQVERLFRYGYSPHLTNTTNWTTGTCPAGHWILQEGTTFHRTDDPAEELRPALIIGVTEGVRPLYENFRGIWEVPVFIEIRYSRNYEESTAEEYMHRLESVFTHGITPDTDTLIPSTTLLSAAATDTVPGLNALYVHEVNSMPLLSDDGTNALVLKLEFTLRCSGIAITES